MDEIWQRKGTKEGFEDVRSSITNASCDVPSEILYHYTTTTAFLQIVESGTLWASGAYFLNDSSEIEYGIDIVRTAVEELYKKHESNAPLRKFLETLLLTFTHGEEQRQLSLFVTCFCTRRDVLSQWRHYATHAGVAIGVDFRGHQKPEQHSEWCFREVEYDTERQIASVKHMLSEIVDAVAGRDYLDTTPAQLHSERWNRLSGAMFASYSALLNLIVGFKHPAFREEHEWRFVVDLSRSFSGYVSEPYNLSGGCVFNTAELGFREGRFALTPYLKLHPRHKLLPISDVCLAPWDNNALARRAVKMYLEMHNKQNIVCAFEAPARS